MRSHNSSGRCRLVYLTLLALSLCTLTTAVLAAAGDLDQSFGTNGAVLTQFGPSQDEARAVAIQPDGKIVVAGFTDPGFFNYDFAVARYNPDGSLDPTFGGVGKVTTDIGSNTKDRAFATAIQTDGKIVVAGQSTLNGFNGFELVRYNIDGSLDSSFGSGGKVNFIVTLVSGSDDAVFGIAIQADGKIVAAGTTGPTNLGDFALMRFNSDGSVDTTFGNNGIVTTGVDGHDIAYSATLQSDGKIVAAGFTEASGSGSGDFALVRYNSNGSLDTSFDGDGKAVTAVSGEDIAHAVQSQTDGKLVVAGYAVTGAGLNDFALVRYNSNGSLDTSFDTDGRVTTSISNNRSDVARALAIESNGKIVVAGSAEVGAANDQNFAVVRYNTDGSVDPTFGSGGKVTTSVAPGDRNDSIYAVALGTDGKMVAVGFADTGSTNSAQDFAVARYISADPPCSVTLTPDSQYFGSSAGSGLINVAAQSTCPWTAVSNDPWITITSNPPTGSGNGTIQFSLPANSGTTQRTGTITINDQTFTVFQAASGCLTLVMGGANIITGGTGDVGIGVGDLTGQGILSFSATITYDPAVVSFAGVDNVGTMSSGFSVGSNVSSPGTVRIAGFGTSPLGGSGNLINMRFTAIGPVGSNSPLNFTSVQFNENGCVQWFNGTGGITVVGRSVSGSVLYGTSPTTLGVPGVRVVGLGNPSSTTFTDASGVYALTGLGTGSLTVVPSLVTIPAANGITAADASLVLQAVLGTATLNANQLIAADVSGNGSVSSFDAALIAKYAVGLPNTVFAGSWRFSPTQLSFPSLPADLTGQDFALILMGEVTGNWTPPSSPGSSQFVAGTETLQQTTTPIATARPSPGGSSIKISLPALTAQIGSIAIPVTLGNYSGQVVTSYQFDLRYDPSVLVPDATPIALGNTISSGFAFEANALQPGILRVAVYGANSVPGNGTLLNLRFNVVGQPRSRSELTLENTLLNEGTPMVSIQNGRLTVKK